MQKKKKKYSGIIVPMITPFKDDGKIDERAVENLLNYFINHKSDVLIFGTTGETASIQQNQKTKSFENIVKKYEGKLKIYAGVSDNSFEDAVSAANTYLDLGAEAVVVLLPGYYPITSDQMLNYYEKFADQIKGKMFIYNIPATTHLSIPIEVIEKLSHHENIIGVKDSERDLERMKKSIELWKEREDFSHFVGWGAQCFNSLMHGSDGIVPSTGNFDLSFYNKLLIAVDESNSKDGENFQDITMEISAVYQKDKILSQSLPALKVMMNEAGLCGTNVLLPFTQLPKNEEKQIRVQTRELIDKYNLTWN